MSVTNLSNLVNPEIMADLIRDKLTDNLRFAPLAKLDDSFVGRPGDTIKLPRYEYIGDAEDVDEGGAIAMNTLNATTAQVKVKKAGKGVKLTDEAMLSGYGDPLGETSAQLALSIAAKVDNDCMAALETLEANRTITAAGVLGGSVIADALTLFGEDIDGDKALLIAPEQLAQLRADESYINRSEIATKMMMNGTVGEIWGCQIVVSNKIKAENGVYSNYIVKPGALAVYLKRDVTLETDRDIEHKLTVITADQHYVAYLLDPSKAVKLKVNKEAAAK